MNDRGSIFIETVIAAAILAMILGAAFTVLRDTSARARRAERMQDAVLIAQSRLAEYPLTRPTPPQSRTGLEGRYRWSVRVDRQSGGALTRGIQPVRLTVTVGSLDDAQVRLTLASLRPGTPG